MAISPQIDTEGPITVLVSCDGKERPDLPLVSVTVRRAVNAIPWARLVIMDGDMTQGNAEIGESDAFAPGAKVTIAAGYGMVTATIFSGIVVRHSVRIGGDNDSRLEIECRHEAIRMTPLRRSEHYVDMTDSAIIQTLISAAGLSATVDSTAVEHKLLAQHHCSDWDFMRARADLLGLVVICTDTGVQVQAPDFSKEPALAVSWGTDLISFSGDIDARTQWKSVQAGSWSPSSQSRLEGVSAKPQDGTSQGNWKLADLSKVLSPETVVLQSCAPQTKDLLDAWATAEQLKAALARVRGQMRFQGSAKAVPGDVVKLDKVSARFNGPCWIGAVQHEIADGNWITEAEFGLPPNWHMELADVQAPPNGGLLPGVRGLHVGKVLKLDGDPESEQRIQISLPTLSAATEGIWARLAQAHASNGFGALFLPEVGDEVIVGFVNDDPSHPVVLGSLYSSANVPPYAIQADNDTKAVVTRSKLSIQLDEAKKTITIETPAKNSLVLDDDGKCCVLQDQHGNVIQLDQDGITLKSVKDIVIKAAANLQANAGAKASVVATTDLEGKGLNVTLDAQASLTAKGAASAELSAAGQTTVKGAMVMIN